MICKKCSGNVGRCSCPEKPKVEIPQDWWIELPQISELKVGDITFPVIISSSYTLEVDANDL